MSDTQKIRENIEEADMILIGIGSSYDSCIPLTGKGMNEEEYLASYYKTILEADRQKEERERKLEFYNTLRALIGSRPYYVVTMSTDDVIYQSDLEEDHIVAPCGSAHMLQCDEHILERYETESLFANIDAALQNSEQGGISFQTFPTCPVCGKCLVPNTIYSKGYLEAGYLMQWNAYTKWLSCTMNRKLCILELDVSFDHPTVIRFPFEKLVSYNRKAALIRINEQFPQLPADLVGCGISVKADGIETIMRL